MSFNVGENVGSYRIVEQLGQGGMATVLKAYHASLDRYVALKVLHPAFNQDAQFEARFQREARVVAKLEHPNIVPVYDYAEHDKRPYLVMKFIEGITLKARMDQGPLTSDEITRIVDAVGAALAYAHNQGVLHRDVKPSNVLLANDGLIYLADFGLARMAQAGESTLSSDSIMGTPQYISPEQAMGKADLDLRTDLYSFGVMLYEMVVGKVPFNADTPFSIIHDHIYTPLPMPRAVNPKVPELVERVLLKSLAKERDDRFDDALQLVNAFKSSWKEAGVSIQGSDVNVSQVLRSEASTIAESGLENKKIEIPGVAEKEESNTNQKKKRSKWWFIIPGILLVICLCLIILTRGNRQNANAQPTISNDVQTQVISDLKDAGIEVLSEVANANPDDPDAQLALALAYWELDRPRDTYDTLPKIVRAAGQDDDEYYIDAGDEFANIEAWVAASAMYYQAVRINHLRGDVPNDQRVLLHEAMYKGAERPEAAAFLQFDVVAEVDQAMSLVSKSRNALHNGRIEEGRMYLLQTKRLAPNMIEIIMLQAEFDQHDGKIDEAQTAIESLLDNERTPDWLYDYAEAFLERLL